MSIEMQIIEKPKKNIEENIKVRGPEDVIEIKEVKAIKNAIREHLLFIGVDRKNNVRNISVLGIGSTGGVILDTKEIIRLALFSSSDKVILVHNHPSNDTQPSKQDLEMTQISQLILQVFNIELLDHIVVTENDYYSIVQDINNEIEIKKINMMSKGLLMEENLKLKKQIQELQNVIDKENDVKEIDM